MKSWFTRNLWLAAVTAREPSVYVRVYGVADAPEPPAPVPRWWAMALAMGAYPATQWTPRP